MQKQLTTFKKIMIIIFSLIFFNLAIAQNSNEIIKTSDAEINEMVQNKLNLDESLTNSMIVVKTRNGMVMLSGDVESNSQADVATEIAQSVPGVTDVDSSKLVIKGKDHPFSDTLITAKIRGLFIQHKLFSDKDITTAISVETNNGVVTLSGKARNMQQAENAVKIAKSVKGVKKVKSNIKVSKHQNKKRV